jgi:hypothetical protein
MPTLIAHVAQEKRLISVGPSASFAGGARLVSGEAVIHGNLCDRQVTRSAVHWVDLLTPAIVVNYRQRTGEPYACNAHWVWPSRGVERGEC